MNESPNGKSWPIDPTKAELTPEELAAVYAKLKAETVPPTEEEIIRLVEESHYNFEDTLKMLDEMEEEPSSRPA